MGHLLKDLEQLLQVTRCPQGMKTTEMSLSMHTLHCFSLCSFRNFSRGSSSDINDRRHTQQTVGSYFQFALESTANITLMLGYLANYREPRVKRYLADYSLCQLESFDSLQQ